MGTKDLAKNDYLKLIAIITMLIDHIGYIFFPDILVFRTIGRIAFPIYAFSIAAGYKFTSNRIRYAKRLLVFALISYIPYIYFNPQLKPYIFRFNVLFLLLAGLGALALWDASITRLRRKNTQHGAVDYFIGLFLLVIFVIYLFLPKIITAQLTLFGVDFAFSYGTYGLCLIMIFYWFYDNPIMGLISFVMLSFGDAFMTSFSHFMTSLETAVDASEYIGYIHYFIVTNWPEILRQDVIGLGTYFFQARAVLGVMLVYLMKPVDARLNLNKYFFYWFYPLHITVIVIFHSVIN